MEVEDCFPLSGQQNTTAPSTRISSNVLKMNFMKRTSLKQLASANTGLTSVYLNNKTAEKQKQKQQQQQQQSQKSQKLTNPTNLSDSPPIEEYGRYSVLADKPLNNNNNKDSVNGIKQEPSDETYPEVPVSVLIHPTVQCITDPPNHTLFSPVLSEERYTVLEELRFGRFSFKGQNPEVEKLMVYYECVRLGIEPPNDEGLIEGMDECDEDEDGYGREGREEGEIASDENETCEGYATYDPRKHGPEAEKRQQNRAQGQQRWGNKGQNKFAVGSVQKKKRGSYGKKKGGGRGRGRGRGARNNRFGQ